MKTASLVRIGRLRSKHPVVEFIWELGHRYRSDQVKLYVTRISYLSFLSIFPLLLLFSAATSILFLQDRSLEQKTFVVVSNNFPFLQSYIKVGSLNGSALAVLAGGVGALWTGLRVTTAIEYGLNCVWKTEIKSDRSSWRRLARGVALLILLGTVFIASILPLAFAGYIRSQNHFAGELLGLLISYVLDVLLFTLVEFLLGPSRLALKWLLPGALPAAAVWLMLQRFGSLLLSRVVSHASHTYGTFGVIVGFLTWLSLGSQLIIIAAIVSSIVYDRKTHGDNETSLHKVLQG